MVISWSSGCLNVIQSFLMVSGTSFNFPGSLVWHLKQKVFQALDSLHAFCTEPASRQKGENEQRIRTFLQPLKLLSPAKVRELCQLLQLCTEVFLSCFDLLQLLLREKHSRIIFGVKILWHNREQMIGKVGGLGLYSFHSANKSGRKERELYGVCEPSGICRMVITECAVIKLMKENSNSSKIKYFLIFLSSPWISFGINVASVFWFVPSKIHTEGHILHIILPFT